MRAASAPARSLAEHAHAHASKSCWPELDAQTAREFEPFARNGGVTREDLDKALERVERISARDHPQDIMRVLVVNGTLHVYQADLVAPATGLPHGWVSSNEGRPHPMVLALLKVHLESAKSGLPDLDIVLNGGDCALSVQNKYRPLPVWSFAKDPLRHNDLWWPYWSMLWLERSKAQGVCRGPPCGPGAVAWAEKVPRLVWRGSQTSVAPSSLVGANRSYHTNEDPDGAWRLAPRSQLVLKCGQLASCDAGFHHWPPRHFSPQVQDEMERETGGLRPALNRSEVLSHKYVALVEGVCGTSASRSVAEFGAGSATFWLESPVHELWEAALRPHVHYIPLKRGLDDLEDTLAWALRNDDAVRKVADEAARFQREVMTESRLACHLRDKLTRYARLLQFEPADVLASDCPLPSRPASDAAPARRFRPLRLHPHAARYMENYMKEHHLWSSRAREVLKRHTA